MPGGRRACNQRHGRSPEQGRSVASGRQSKGYQQGKEEAQPDLECNQVRWLRHGTHSRQTR